MADRRETQSIEFKSSWKDEYLKTLSAFANTDGGRLIVGIDDHGNVIGVKNAKKLLESIPSKVRNKLSITPYVKVESKGGKDIVNILINPSSAPVSYEGKFYTRSGSTTVEITGNELIEFLISKSGKTWDTLPSEASFEDISKDTVNFFKSVAKKRVPSISESDSVQKIFTNLGLITEDNKITNAGLLLFGKNPQRFLITVKARVGRFKDSATILDTVIAEGNLFKQLETTFEAIKKHLNV